MPPTTRPRPQDFNRDQALRAIDMFRRGGLTPDQYRVLEATQPPAQLAQLQQQFAQVSGPAAENEATDAVVQSMLRQPAPPSPTQPTIPIPVPSPTAPQLYHPDQAGTGSALDAGGGAWRAPRGAGLGGSVGRAPGGGGDATFGGVGSQVVERPGAATGIAPNLYPGTDAEGRPLARSPERGGESARVTVHPITEQGIRVDVGDERFFMIPPDVDPEQWLLARVSRSLGETNPDDFADPYNPRLDSVLTRQTIDQLGDAYQQRWALGSQGTGEPRMDATVRQQLREPGQVSAVTAARLGAADLAVEGAHGFAQAAGDAGLVGRTAVGQRVSGAQAAEAADMERRARERTQRLMAGLEGVDRRLDDVASMRVDVNEAFGGMGGRIGAAIAVALGSIASSLGGGGENQALAIVNSIVERNLQAQRSNIDNARADASARGNAFRDMAGLLGDEEAATQAARALHLTAIAAAGDRFVQGLDQQQQTAWQLLRSRLMEQAAVARQAAQEMAATASTTDVRLGFRGGQSAVMSSVAGVTGQSAGQPGPGRMPAPSTSNGQPRPAGQGPRRSPAPASAPAGQPEPTAEAAEAPRPYQGRVPTPEELRDMQERHRESARAVPVVGARLVGTSANRPDPAAQATFDVAWNGTGNERTQIRELVATARIWGQAVPRIIAANEEFDAELTNSEPTVARAQQQANLLRMNMRRMFTGAAFSEQERQDYIDMLPAPGEINAENLLEMWDSFGPRWVGAAEALLRDVQARLSTFGLEVDSALTPDISAARQRGEERIRTRRRRSARPSAPSPAENAPPGVTPGARGGY